MLHGFFYFLLALALLIFLGDSKNLNIDLAPREILFGECYNIELPASFQPEQFVSKTWYELGRYRNDLEKDAECVYITADIDPDDGSWILVFNLKLPDNSTDTVFGTVRPTNDSKFESQLQDDSAWSSFSIVDTDYDNYGIIYSCWQKPHEPMLTKQERLWVLGRETELTTEIQQKINKALHITGDIDLSRYIYETNQKTCS